MNPCSICFEPFTANDRYGVGHHNHLFHRSCITSWRAINPTCPLCRIELPKLTYVRNPLFSWKSRCCQMVSHLFSPSSLKVAALSSCLFSSSALKGIASVCLSSITMLLPMLYSQYRGDPLLYEEALAYTFFCSILVGSLPAYETIPSAFFEALSTTCGASVAAAIHLIWEKRQLVAANAPLFSAHRQMQEILSSTACFSAGMIGALSFGKWAWHSLEKNAAVPLLSTFSMGVTGFTTSFIFEIAAAQLLDREDPF